MRKNDEMAAPASTWNRAGLDEPLFILRSTDLMATEIVQEWITRMEDEADRIFPKNDQGLAIAGEIRAKAVAARLLLESMLDWQAANPQLVKLPGTKKGDLNAANESHVETPDPAN